MIVFDPHPPFFHVCSVDRAGNQTESKMLVGNQWEKSVELSLERTQPHDGTAYVLHHGAELIVRPADRVTEETISLLRETVPVLPEHNEYTSRFCSYLFHSHPELPQVLLCDTAFFSRLPAEARTYAVPEELRNHHVGRYGASGLIHEWAWKKLLRHCPSIHTCVSVVLGDHSNIAAIRDGRPIETTAGFTPVEGIPSATSCGDIDPMIVFELRAKGLSIQEINRILSNESGFRGMVQKRCGFLELIRADASPEVTNAREVFRYSLLTHIGAMISVLGGADAVLFETESFAQASTFVGQLSKQLEFLEPAVSEIPRRKGDFWWFCGANAHTKVLAINFNKWEVLAERARLALTEASL